MVITKRVMKSIADAKRKPEECESSGSDCRQKSNLERKRLDFFYV